MESIYRLLYHHLYIVRPPALAARVHQECLNERVKRLYPPRPH
jgi:hypothetical protein